MVTRPYRLRIDPWSAEYDAAAGQLEGSEPTAAVDATVEHERWRALRPAPDARPARLAFVDGVRRIDCRFVVELGTGAATPAPGADDAAAGRTHAQGLFGSFAVGAASSNGSARVVRAAVGRLAAVGSGVTIEPVAVRIGAATVEYRCHTTRDDAPDAPLRLLQNEMRRAEAALAPSLLAEHDAVFVDGPLSPLSADGAQIGYVKRLLRSYLDPDRQALLALLQDGQRTPLFRIAGAPLDRWSWYLRIGRGRAIDAALAGVVRCEAAARHDLDAARALADLSARQLPRFASDRLRDPRAPQNLFPIGALEGRLRHRLGDALLLRRGLERALAGRTGY